MRSNTVLRCAVLLLAALLAVDATWCGDEVATAQPTSAHSLTLTDGACSDGVAQLDCHACICSGLALIETAPLYAPPLQSTALTMIESDEPVSETRSIDIPPDKRG